MTGTIVIPVYNQEFYTRIALASLAVAEPHVHVLVVDNGSTDGTPELLAWWQRQQEGRTCIRLQANQGFAAACNLGASSAGTELVVFLNNDTFVLPGWYESLTAPLSDPQVKITGCRLLYPNGSIQHAGVAFDERAPHHIFAGLPGDHPLVLRRREWQAVTGAAMAVRGDEFQAAGGFDDGYRNSFEDVDYCLRIRHSGGRILYVPEAVAYHFESISEGRTGPTDLANHKRFFDRWGGRWDVDLKRETEAARAAGHDLEERLPSKAERAHLEKVRLEQTNRELEALRKTARLRSVRAALWMRRLLRAQLDLVRGWAPR